MPTIQLKVRGNNYSFGWSQRTVTVNQAQQFMRELSPEKHDQIVLTQLEHDYQGTKKTLTSKTKITPAQLFTL